MKAAKILAFAVLISPLASVPASAQQPARAQAVRPGTTETLEGCGLRIKTFKDCKAIPGQPLDCRTGTDPKTGQAVEVYPGPEYWRKEQIVGEWSGAGAGITVYEMKYPADKIPRIVSREAFAKWAEENKLPAEPDISTWIKAVSGLDATPAGTKLKGEGDAAITPYDCTGGANHMECYLVRSAKAGRTLLCVYELERGKVDVERSKSVVKSSVQAIGFFAPKAVVVKQQPNSAVNGKRTYSAEFLASKQKVIDGIKNLKGWWFLETENYLLVSNQKNRQAMDTIKKDMEKARTAFEAVYPVIGEIKAVSVIRVPATRAEYLAYIGPEYKWSGGIWMPSKNELVISDSDWGDNRSKAGQIREVLFHEGFHQYLSYAADGEADVWFNEGHARFFEGLEFTGSTFRVNCQQSDAALVMQMVSSGRAGLQKMFTMSHQDFYAAKGSDKERSEHYSLAWGIVYYMNKGALCSKKTERYTEIPLRYYLTLQRTHNARAAMTAAMDGVEVAQLEKDFIAFWKDSGNVRRSASQPFVKERLELLKKLQKLPEFAGPASSTPSDGE